MSWADFAFIVAVDGLIYFTACWLFPRSIWKKEHLL